MTTVFHEVGRYAIHRELGRGGMATVFLATDTDLHVDVALKQVPVGSDREAREILEAEEWGAQLQACFSQMFDCVPKVYRSWKEGEIATSTSLEVDLPEMVFEVSGRHAVHASFDWTA